MRSAPVDRLQSRLESSPAGQVAISALIVAVVAAIVLTNLPGSALKQATAPVVSRAVNAVGLDQNWNVFAPNPRTTSLQLQARVTYADGETDLWTLPAWDPWVGTYRSYRWRKWMSYVRLDANQGELWEPTARWIARVHTRGGREVEQVTLIRRWYEIPAPGAGRHVPPWNEYEFYTLRVR